MSAPFGGPPRLPVAGDDMPAPVPDIHAAMAALARPRKHYQWYYSSREADADMHDCAQGIHDFMRAYYHVKSADWPRNAPYRLEAWDAESLALMPTYYIMDAGQTMAETVAPHLPTPAQIASNEWLPEAELRVYSDEYRRTGFQGGLQWYRCATSPRVVAEMQLWSGRTIDVPSAFFAGRADWGVYQRPGDLERMRDVILTRLVTCELIDGAGHWVQQEQPEALVGRLLAFLREAESARPG
ncbi:MAG: alpha/beta hydrolase [Burkholderiaceae bacterium]